MLKSVGEKGYPMRRLLGLGMILALATPAMAAPNPAKLRIGRSSPEEMTRFATAHVCLPIVADGAALETTIAGAAFPWKLVPGAFALYGTTPNYVKLDGRGGCYFRIDHGDPAKLRVAVLDALKEAGAPTTTADAFDSGPDGSDGRGKYRQEGYCLEGPATGGKPLGMVMSTGTAMGPKLQLSVFKAPAGRCGRPKP
jgi:hypothetical protein